MCKPTICPTLAIASSEEFANLCIVIGSELLRLPVQELAVLSGEAPARGSVELAYSTSLRRDWPLGHHERFKKSCKLKAGLIVDMVDDAPSQKAVMEVVKQALSTTEPLRVECGRSPTIGSRTFLRYVSNMSMIK